MEIDYSKYTRAELIDVYRNIDKEQYPERYQMLCDEIKRREHAEQSPVKGNERALEESDDYEEDKDFEFVLTFSTQDAKNRFRFLGVFVLINIMFLAFIIPKYIVKDIAQIHQYSTQVTSIECKKIELIDEETDKVSIVFDLNIYATGNVYSAVGIDKTKCQQLAKTLRPEENVSIWHEEGLMYQLSTPKGMLLSYQYLKPKIKALQSEDVSFIWIGLFAVWAFLFKSLVNAISPGTFGKNDD